MRCLKISKIVTIYKVMKVKSHRSNLRSIFSVQIAQVVPRIDSVWTYILFATMQLITAGVFMSWPRRSNCNLWWFVAPADLNFLASSRIYCCSYVLEHALFVYFVFNTATTWKIAPLVIFEILNETALFLVNIYGVFLSVG